MRGQDALGDGEALTAEEQAVFDASQAAEPAVPDVPAVDAQADPAVEADADPAAEAPAGQAQQQQPKMVPHEAMHQERRLRQEAEEREKAERKRAQTLEERMNLLLQRGFAQPEQPAAQKPEAAPLPDINQDPVGNIVGQIGQLRNDLGQRDQVIAAIAQAISGQNRQAEAAREADAEAIRATAMEREFAAQTPDYQDAYQHLLRSREAELRANGWSDPAEIQALLVHEARGLVSGALRRGQNPAAVAYELSKIRGYQQPATAPNGQQPAQTAAAAAQVASIAAGQQQARGINRVPGQATAPPSAATIANMSDEEFTAWVSKASDKDRRSVGL